MRRFLLALLLGLAACQRSDPPAPTTTTQIVAHELRTELRSELLAMVERDQAARELAIASPDDKPLWIAAAAIDHANTTRMKQIVATHGWPGHRLVGRDGANAAWLLVQHADADLPFQKLCLDKLAAAVAAGDADASDHAYLVDRVAVAENRPQTFGTQFGGGGEPLPIEDAANVDARRAAVGLGTLAEYRAQMAQ